MNFLNEETLNAHLLPGKEDFYLESQAETLREGIKYKARPERIIQLQAQKAGLFTCAVFYRYLWTFHKLLRLNEEIRNYFEDRTMEEWSMLYLQVYLESHSKPQIQFEKMLNDGFFLEKVNLLFHPDKDLFQVQVQFDEACHFKTKLTEFFSHLELTKVTKRQNQTAFEKEILPKFEKSFNCKFYYLYVLHYMQSLKIQGSTSKYCGHWHILDIPHFIEELGNSYQEEMQIELNELTKDEQENHANQLFICLLYYLITRDLDDWGTISAIPFFSNIQKLHQFCHDLKNNKITI